MERYCSKCSQVAIQRWTVFFPRCRRGGGIGDCVGAKAPRKYSEESKVSSKFSSRSAGGERDDVIHDIPNDIVFEENTKVDEEDKNTDASKIIPKHLKDKVDVQTPGGTLIGDIILARDRELGEFRLLTEEAEKELIYFGRVQKRPLHRLKRLKKVRRHSVKRKRKEREMKKVRKMKRKKKIPVQRMEKMSS